MLRVSEARSMLVSEGSSFIPERCHRPNFPRFSTPAAARRSAACATARCCTAWHHRCRMAAPRQAPAARRASWIVCTMRQTGVGGVWKCGKRRGLMRVWRGGPTATPRSTVRSGDRCGKVWGGVRGTRSRECKHGVATASWQCSGSCPRHPCCTQ